MPTLATGNCGQLGTKVLDQMHEFRHDVFVRRLGWALPMVNGVERDQYDTTSAKYVVLSDDAGRVTASARLVPSTGEYMLPKLFPQLLGARETPREPGVWELSRFAATVRETGAARVLTLSQPTLDFLELVLIFARRHAVERLIFVTSVGIERLMRRAGLAVERVAAPALVDDHLCVALFIDVSRDESGHAAFDSYTARPTYGMVQARA
jgi:acyl homoserine lactone synthase